MAARSASQDAKSLAKMKQREAVQSDDDEEDNQEEEDTASPSKSEIEKTARQNQKTADLPSSSTQTIAGRGEDPAAIGGENCRTET